MNGGLRKWPLLRSFKLYANKSKILDVHITLFEHTNYF